VFLDANLVGLSKPCRELLVDVIPSVQPELVDYVAGRDHLDLGEPRAVDPPGQHQMPCQPPPARHKGCEAHAGVQRDPGSLRQHLDRAERLGSGPHPIEDRPHLGRRPGEVLIKIAEASAGVLAAARPVMAMSRDRIGPETSGPVPVDHRASVARSVSPAMRRFVPMIMFDPLKKSAACTTASVG
jgi:hypothetical protein